MPSGTSIPLGSVGRCYKVFAASCWGSYNLQGKGSELMIVQGSNGLTCMATVQLTLLGSSSLHYTGSVCGSLDSRIHLDKEG